MVIFLEWHWTSSDLKSSSSLPMTSEGTGLEALASPLAGYLEKVQARAASLEHCPWCMAKGVTSALRSYRVNLQESIILCTNPECLFPLVTRSLEDVLASLSPVEPAVGTKRKTTSTLEEEELIKPATKRQRSSELDNHAPQNGSTAPISPEENGAANGQHAAPIIDSEKMNGSQRECPVSDTAEWELPRVNDATPRKDSVGAAHEDVLAPHACLEPVLHSSEVLQMDDGVEAAASLHCGSPKNDLSSPAVLDSLDSGQPLVSHEDPTLAHFNPPFNQQEKTGTSPEQQSKISEITMCKEIASEEKDLSQAEELVSVPNQLFWKNSDNLCWLDSLLVALVNCKTLRSCKPHDEPQQSSVWRLIQEYEDICVSIQAHHRIERDGVARVPDRFLKKANKDLQSLRMSVFKALEPKLHCKLGQRETPVFALPLLLSMDSWAECLFQSTFHWEFKCGACRAATRERVNKTISTCTNLLPDWRPLHAVHMAPCNMCRSKDQKRTMKLVRVPPVFALHFVEGLPSSDLSAYSFDFKGKHYSVTTVIQYDRHLKHFVTWIRHSDGSWQEYDDLKHPDCKVHENLQVPAEELHVLLWEVDESKDSSSCSPSSTFIESSSSESPEVGVLNDGADDPVDVSPDQTLSVIHNDTDIVSALSVSDTTVSAERDTSIGADTLLDTFEGLTHDDIVTLTLVNISAESETNRQTPEVSVSSESEAVTTTADTSTAVDGEACRNPEVEVHNNHTSSKIDTLDNPPSEPTNGPVARRTRARAATQSRQKAKSKEAQVTVPPSQPSSKTSVSDEAQAPQNDTPHVEVTPQESPVSSVASPPPATQKPVQSKLEPHTPLSYLLSKHPLNPFQKSISKLAASSTRQMPAPRLHSTPSTVKRLQTPATTIYPKAQLRTEGEGFPPRPAEMYGGFGAKGSNSHTASKPPHPVTSNHINAAEKTTASFQTHGDPLRKQSSNLPQDLGSTDLLRHKLLKKLKAKKKKLAKLNKLLGLQGGASLQPDSTDLGSPSTVTSSTHDGSTYDDFLSDLLSPATTASHLSPDSTEFLEMLASGKDGADQTDCATAVLPPNDEMNKPNPDNFLEEFLSKAAAQTPTDMEAEALDALELFV